MKITVAGTGYVGLSMAVLLSQNNDVTAVDIVPEKVELLNSRKSPIADKYIEEYLAEKPLSLAATTDCARRTPRLTSWSSPPRLTTTRRRTTSTPRRWKALSSRYSP